jgi:predicted ArsR family transcriptional regulator
VPEPIAGLVPELSEGTVRATERAAAAAQRSNTPVLDIATAARLLDVSDEAARGAVTALEQRDILARIPVTAKATGHRGRPPNRWSANELLSLIRR